MFRTWRFHGCGPGSIPGRGTKIPQAAWPGWKKKEKDKKKKLSLNSDITSLTSAYYRLHQTGLSVSAGSGYFPLFYLPHSICPCLK